MSINRDKLNEDEVTSHYINGETRKRAFITEKYLEETYALDKVKPDNIMRSTAHYLQSHVTFHRLRLLDYT